MPRLNSAYDPIVEAVIRACNRGAVPTSADVRAEHGLTGKQMKHLRDRLRRAGISLKPGVRGATHDEEAEIRRLHAEGHSIRVIAERLKRSRWFVSDVIHDVAHRARGMTPEAKADRVIEREQRANALAAGQGDWQDAPPPWRKIVPCPRVVASLRHHYASEAAAYEAAQRHVFRVRHGVSMPR